MPACAVPRQYRFLSAITVYDIQSYSFHAENIVSPRQSEYGNRRVGFRLRVLIISGKKRILWKIPDMKNNAYKPSPVFADDVELPEDIMALSERMAENVHEVWAAARMAEGWVWGEKRDDKLKHHPCLVPYDQLPESEKEYDRKTAIQTLRFILKSGYSIKKSDR